MLDKRILAKLLFLYLFPHRRLSSRRVFGARRRRQRRRRRAWSARHRNNDPRRPRPFGQSRHAYRHRFAVRFVRAAAVSFSAKRAMIFFETKHLLVIVTPSNSRRRRLVFPPIASHCASERDVASAHLRAHGAREGGARVSRRYAGEKKKGAAEIFFRETRWRRGAFRGGHREA